MLEIYYGEGKGKERVCIGAAITAALRDKNVLLVNFQQKVDNYDKLFAIAPHLTRLTLEPNTGVREYFDHAVRMALSFQYSVLILHQRSRQHRDHLHRHVGPREIPAACQRNRGNETRII